MALSVSGRVTTSRKGSVPLGNSKCPVSRSITEPRSAVKACFDGVGPGTPVWPARLDTRSRHPKCNTCPLITLGKRGVLSREKQRVPGFLVPVPITWLSQHQALLATMSRNLLVQSAYQSLVTTHARRQACRNLLAKKMRGFGASRKPRRWGTGGAISCSRYLAGLTTSNGRNLLRIEVRAITFQEAQYRRHLWLQPIPEL